MNLQNLQEHLRAHIRVRIGRGELTGSGLASAARFPQGHLSNFLNRRRGLSMESMDRLLVALEIGLLDLVDADEIRQSAVFPESGAAASVVMVAAEHAGLQRFTPEQILETRSFSKSFLRRLKPLTSEDRRDWLRFVLIKLEVARVRDMFPLAASTATLLIDRHYSSLQPYRRLRPNIYAVSFSGRCLMGYLSVFDGHLVLRRRDPQLDVEVMRIKPGRIYSQYIIGRVCHIGLEV